MAKGTVKITAPNEHFTGVVADVGFAKGVGEVDNNKTALIDWFRRKGYGIGDSEPTVAKAPGTVEPTSGGTEADVTVEPAKTDDLESKTVKDLKAVAKKAGITGVSGLNKKDLIKVLRKQGVG